MLTAALFLLGMTAFCQEEKNGTIYIKHPYIEVLNKIVTDYVKGDYITVKKSFADTAIIWQSGMKKFLPIDSLIQHWTDNHMYITDISMKPMGYPDFLHYKDQDARVVQSWWTWSAKVIKTGEVISVPIVIFDDFNSNGKIVRQIIYGDFSAVRAAEM